MTSTDDIPLPMFNAIRVRPDAADFRSVAVPSKAYFLAVLEGWRLVPFSGARAGEEVLAFVALPRSRGIGLRLIRIPDLEGKRDPSGAPFKGWTYAASHSAYAELRNARQFDWKLRNRRSSVSAHQVAARARQLRTTFPPIQEAEDAGF